MSNIAIKFDSNKLDLSMLSYDLLDSICNTSNKVEVMNSGMDTNSLLAESIKHIFLFKDVGDYDDSLKTHNVDLAIFYLYKALCYSYSSDHYNEVQLQLLRTPKGFSEEMIKAHFRHLIFILLSKKHSKSMPLWVSRVQTNQFFKDINGRI